MFLFFFMTFCAAFLYEKYVAKDVFLWLPALIVIAIMVLTVQWATETIARKNKTDTSSIGKKETGTKQTTGMQKTTNVASHHTGAMSQEEVSRDREFAATRARFRVVRSDGSYREFSDQPTAERIARTDREAGHDVKIVKV